MRVNANLTWGSPGLADWLALQRRVLGRRPITLRAKGFVALAVLFVYLLAIGLHVTHERAKLLHIVQQLDHVHENHELLSNVQLGLTHSAAALQKQIGGSPAQIRYEDILLDFVSAASSLPQVKQAYPDMEPAISAVEQRLEAVDRDLSRDAVIALRDSQFDLIVLIEKVEARLQQRAEQLSQEYRARNDDLTVVAAGGSLLGLALFGIGVTWFFTRLSADIRALEARAVAIVGGYRGTPLSIRRLDEVGGLVRAVNRMQSELRQREQQQEISREQRFHQEKLAAVGSLAAAVAHEVNNPINAISGIAQHTLANFRSSRRAGDQTLFEQSAVIVQQAERIATIVRQLADFSAPHAPTAELLNLNELVQSTCGFVRFDKRFRSLELVTDLAQDLPAVFAVGDHLRQVLMNLLINAADAVDPAADRKAEILVWTYLENGRVVLAVSDNGHGMSPQVMSHAFEQHFTTKPAGRGRGIGLFLCKTLIEEAGGSIALESTPGHGTTARVYLPVTPASEA